MTTSGQATYGPVSRINHWLIALAAIGLLGVGFFLANIDLDRPTRGMLIGLHKATGVLVLIYAVWRIGWRVVNGFPQVLGDPSAFSAFLARAVHWGLMLGILVMPISGIVMSIFNGHAVDVFGLFVIPAQGKVPEIGGPAHEIHEIAGYVVLALVLVHTAAALKHHLIDGNATLIRMITGAATR